MKLFTLTAFAFGTFMVFSGTDVRADARGYSSELVDTTDGIVQDRICNRKYGHVGRLHNQPMEHYSGDKSAVDVIPADTHWLPHN